MMSGKGTGSYTIESLDHRPLTARLDRVRLTGPLRVTPPPYRQSTGWRASGLGSCLRQVGYRLLDLPATHDTYVPSWTLSADIGTTIHTRIQEQLVGSGLAVLVGGVPAIEVPLPAGAPVTGHVDAVIRTNAGALAILDVKTGSPREFVPGYRYLGDKQQKWATQVHAYMAAFYLPDGEYAREAYILHISRGDTADRHLFRIVWQPEAWARDVARLAAAQEAVAAGDLPAPEPGACRFCAFRQHCPANDYPDQLEVQS